MSNILKVTTPALGYENAVNKQNINQPENLGIQAPVRADNAAGAGNKEEFSGMKDGSGIYQESNFANFIRTLQEVPKLREIMGKLMFGGMEHLVESGVRAQTAQDISTMLQLLNMSSAEAAEFLKKQTDGANRLHGPLFDLLRQVMSESTTVELKFAILEFLKKYNDMSSGTHIMNNIQSELKEIQKYMFRQEREQLDMLMKQLKPHTMKDSEANTELLKGRIIPFLGKYISDTGNMGKIRDIINLLTYNTSRYENGALDSVMQAFKKLEEFPAFQKRFGGMTSEEVAKLFERVNFDKAAGREEWSDKFLEIMRAGVRGEAGTQVRETFLNLLNSTLVNESVYMPLLHLAIPLIIEGVPIFSEMWIDPDEESDEENAAGGKGVKILLKFDMKEVGFFDILMYYQNNKMSMVTHYPDTLPVKGEEIRKGISGILKKNGMEVEYLAVEEGKESIPVSKAFPKIYERRNSVNVTI